MQQCVINMLLWFYMHTYDIKFSNFRISIPTYFLLYPILATGEYHTVLNYRNDAWIFIITEESAFSFGTGICYGLFHSR